MDHDEARVTQVGHGLAVRAPGREGRNGPDLRHLRDAEGGAAPHRVAHEDHRDVTGAVGELAERPPDVPQGVCVSARFQPAQAV
ncbi:hypothetical protein [Streptomyces sp. NPDC055013]